MSHGPKTMKGMVLTGHGGLDKLLWRDDLPVPEPTDGEVLIRVGASAVNNTDINTRIGWYSKSVRSETGAGAADGLAEADDRDGGWLGTPIRFPRIQGADCCGVIVAAGAGVSLERIGQRVLVRPLQTTGAAGDPFATWTFGSECDGAFAEYTKTFAEDALPVSSRWTDMELASIPCAYSTAEGMLQRARVGAERVLVTGASGGVGSAAIQLAKRRGARVAALTSADKTGDVMVLGADETIDRDGVLDAGTFDVVVDLVAGPRWPEIVGALRRGGRYVTAGAIAGPIVELDVRTLYLRDLTLFGTTYQPENILPDVIGYIEKDEIRPVIAEAFELREMRAAQQAFLTKSHVGKIGIRVAPETEGRQRSA
jgi:NADPH:quinone reductase-like Zn-dependent oxidoreductase